MSGKTGIEWTEKTWNPVTGCDRCSAGCDNCYALSMAGRLKLMGSAAYQVDGDPRTSGPGFAVQCHDDRVGQPVRWSKPAQIFVNSMSDLFHSEVPTGFIARLFAVMAVTPRHTFQVLTKRPARMRLLLNDPRFVASVEAEVARLSGRGVEVLPAGVVWPLRNVWLGVSVEDAGSAWRVDRLRETPAAVRFVSAEPLLGPVDGVDFGGVDWLIVGGESGFGARPMHPVWARGAVAAGRRAGAAVFFKQWGMWSPVEPGAVSDTELRCGFAVWMGADGSSSLEPGDGRVLLLRGPKSKVALLDGERIAEFPAVSVS